ncbi:histidine kinase [Leptospira congkakensis]|uniref:Histidine kinase n=1 Tax=Leptospira congkakensis TaxID=2484932 RepID=A0A4Z1A5A0_9LEPT|nr:7TM diverse intracellular signaling domain-containing protein [Leptospira congkakensis]TGL87153.1 histidine kinase [Leptospira congkakensis]TGL96721.1 histidine kinase [Leptospira congkakensis]TGL97570.1 histidine kinase [Leptospira congkakensis]
MAQDTIVSWIPRSVIYHAKILIVVLFLYSCQTNPTDESSPKVIDGKIVLNESNLQNQTAIKLDGEWEFYYERLLSSEDFKNDYSKLKRETITLPGFWNETKKNGKYYSPYSYATFRLHLTIPKSYINSSLSFYIPHAFTTYRMYTNGTLISENGIVGISKQDTKEYWLPKAVFFTPNSENLEIIIHVANYKALNAGFRQSIEISTESNMVRIKQIRLALDIFLISSLFVISLYHFTLYLLRKNDLSLFYFSLYSFVNLVYKITSGEFFLLIIFPDFDWDWLIKIFFLSIYSTFPLLLCFLGRVFPEEINKKTNNTFQFLFLIFSIFVLDPKSTWIEETLLPAEVVMLFCCFYVFYILIKAVKNKRESATGFLLGFVFLFLTIINDILFEKNIIKTEVYGPIGTFVLFFSQSFFLSKKHSNLYVTVEKQKEELEQSALLKEKVYRTNIHSKRMELELYKKTIQPHFLMNSLSAIRYWVSESAEKSALILDSLVGELRIILKVASKQLIPIGDEIELCKYHIGVMTMRMEKEYRFKTLGIDYTEEIPPLIFHTLIENAFTHEDSLHAKLSFGIFKKKAKKDEKLFSQYCFIVYNHAKIKESNQPKTGSGTGLEYVRLRLEESYSGKWSLTHGKSKKGYRVLIQIQIN